MTFGADNSVGLKFPLVKILLAVWAFHIVLPDPVFTKTILELLNLLKSKNPDLSAHCIIPLVLAIGSIWLVRWTNNFEFVRMN